MPEPSATPRTVPERSGRAWPLALAVGLLAAAFFGVRLAAEPFFPDEAAFIAQSYFLDLFLQGKHDDWAWVEYHAYDLPPLPKYLIGAALNVSGDRPPGRLAAGAWFHNIKRPIVSPKMLQAARWPSVFLGAIGCAALFAIGTVAVDRRVGFIAALMLMINPLYAIHARRAMADAPAEALILATLAVALWSWRTTLAGRIGMVRQAALAVVVGILGGLAVLAKLNGGLALMVVGAWGVLGLGLPGFPWSRRLRLVAAAMVSGVVALVTFVALNPFVTARPTGPPPPLLMAPAPPDQGMIERLRIIIAHRAQVSREAQSQFPHDALTRPLEKIKTVAVQGFGRFGLFGPRDHDSTRPYKRYDWSRDWGALLWLPGVAAGIIWAGSRGCRQWRLGQPPTAWALLVQAIVALVTVTAFIPLAWDRYVLSIQPGSALLASGLLVALLDRMLGRSTASKG